MNILIVDDSPSDVILMHYRLKKVGYTDFLTATSANESFKILKMDDPDHLPDIDLILMDIEMPEISGIEACRQIKLTNHVKDIPVIMVSARNDLSSFKLALSAGALDYLQKPVQEAELLARVHSALKLKHEIDMRRAREKELVKANQLLEREREKAEGLLHNILPAKIVKDLKSKGTTKPELFKNVTVFFSDIVQFTQLSSMLEPEALIIELDEMFTEFDEIMEKNQCERIKTIGDAYLAVCGMPEKNSNHAENMANAALEIVEYLKKRNESKLINWKIRIGMHTGVVIGSVVGIKKYIYDIFGDTVNTASRMESQSEPMKINISEITYNLVKDKFNCIERPKMHLKGKSNINMYFLTDKK